ncbi:hypothetical protein I3842_03G162800 [Carya illinoinensis]|uniref:Protein TIC 20 n=1 Tax=Carya illinoinensis TaxID=32201 RepID=A0A922FGT5_CARIL|nr:hypothetical protein I3842_03G162800 [Carya illinoinensis]
MSVMAAGAAPPASSSRLLFNPPRRPLLPPAGLSASLRFRYKDTIPLRFSKTCRVHEPLASRTVVACRSKGMSFIHSAASSKLLGGEQIGLSPAIPVLPRQRKALTPVRASKNNPFSYRLPIMNEKPEWWYRILACVPYLLALQMSDTAFYVLPFLERYEVLESLYYYIPGAVRRLPWWFNFAHFYLAYLGVVRNNKWPHYLRFHVAMGFLLESALMVVVNSSNLMPLIHFQGTFGLYYWAAVGFIYIVVMLECVRCALAGTYVKLPLISDSAFIHTLFRVGGYQRPF